MSERVCLTPRLQGVGGMVSFQAKLTEGLRRRGVQATYDLTDRPYAAVLVIGGTRRVDDLWRARRRGARIVQRLNGMNWLHRLRPVGWRTIWRAESGNWLLQLIRTQLADGIIYQSRFSQQWWERVYGPVQTPATMIHNAVDLQQYTPNGAHQRPTDVFRLLLVEGSFVGGYEIGLEHAVGLAERLQTRHALNVELQIAGRVSARVQAEWQNQTRVPLHWAGLLTRKEIPALDRSAHALYAGDINAACPNSVIEALACGLPVVAFDTGALPELVDQQSGWIAAYGGDPWRLDPPDLDGLADGAAQVLVNNTNYRDGARRRAEAHFDLEAMTERYLEVLLK